MRRHLRSHRVLSFVLLAFVLSYGLSFGVQWVIGTLGLATRAWTSWLPGVLAVLGPALAAAIVVTASGQSFTGWLASDWRNTRVAWCWAVVPILTLVITALAFRLAGLPSDALLEAAISNLPLLAGLYAFQIGVVGLLEEIGWRGWLLREQMGKDSPLVATLSVAVVWGAWHLPKLLSSPTLAAALTGAVIVNSFLLTVLYSRLQGRIALAALAHGSFNAPIYFFEREVDVELSVQAFGYCVALYGVIALLIIARDPRWWVAAKSEH
jgi:membrane protease YdiL (CAAX protease family)